MSEEETRLQSFLYVLGRQKDSLLLAAQILDRLGEFPAVPEHLSLQRARREGRELKLRGCFRLTSAV